MRTLTAGLRHAAIVIAASLAFATAGQAADLTLGVQVEPTSIDPHYANVDTNNATALHFFTPLVIRDEKLQPVPGLATSWRLVDETTWEFKLRQGVKFHDGGDFTAEDVKFSIERARNIPNSPSSLAVYLNQIASIDIVDAHTIRFKTNEVFPLMPIFMGTFGIVSKRAADGASTDDFNAGKAMVGTGPFKFVSWERGQKLVMERFDGYWGEKPDWDRVTFRTIPTGAARLAALLSGDVDMIDFVPTNDIPGLKQRSGFVLSQGVTIRLIFLTFDLGRDNSPHVTDKSGKPFATNGPLRDARVRKAISKAIDRKAIADRIMDGASAPASQIMPEGFFGYDPETKPEAYDPEGARKLLAEAGFPNGFAIAMHLPRNRYVNDVKTMEAIAQMLARIGIEVKVEAVPVNIFFTQATQRLYSAWMIGFGIVTGEPMSFLSLNVLTFDGEKKVGTGNRARYSNKKVDALIERASATVDDGKRQEIIREATRIAISEDQAFVPLHHQVHTWAMKKGLVHTPRTDEYTLAQDVRLAK